jgi:hypothetical protein
MVDMHALVTGATGSAERTRRSTLLAAGRDRRHPVWHDPVRDLVPADPTPFETAIERVTAERRPPHSPQLAGDDGTER